MTGYTETLTVTLPESLAEIAAKIGTKGNAGPALSKTSDLTHEIAAQLFSYDPDTGLLTRRVTMGGQQAGSVVTRRCSTGYVAVGILGRYFRAHRIGWLLMTGDHPPAGTEIDHINGVRDDNRWINLRAVHRAINQHNLGGAKKTNKLGFLGVSKANDKFQAEIVLPGKVRKYLGVFPTPELAHAAYLAAKQQHYPGVMRP